MNLTICKWMLLVVVIPLGIGGFVHAAEEQKVGKLEKERLAGIEQNVGGRLGAAVLDTDNSRGLEYRASERFPMCSTFKLLAAAAVLHRVDVGQEKLDRRISSGRRICSLGLR
jgi:beta-lactamase class A